LLLGSGEGMGEEVEVFIDRSFAEERSGTVYQVPAHVGLPVLQRMLDEEFFLGAEKSGNVTI